MDGATEENAKEEEGEDQVDEVSTDKKADTPVLCTLEQLTRLAQRLGAEWKKLAPKLGFKADEVTKSMSQFLCQLLNICFYQCL